MTTPTFPPIAPISRRVVAYIIDAMIPVGIIVVFAVIAGVLGGMAAAQQSTGLAGGAVLVMALMYIALIGWTIVYLVMLGGEKGSIGMRAQRIRLIRQDTGASLGFGYALLRYLIFGLAGSIVVGYFSPLFDKSGRNQGWHDMVAKSLMVEGAGATAKKSDAVSAPSAAAPATPPAPAWPAPSLASAPAVPPAPAAPVIPAAPPAPVIPAAPELPAVGVPNLFGTEPGRPAADVVPDETVIAPRATPPAADDVIAFVPGVTQDAAPVRPVVAEPIPGPPAPPVPSPQPAEAAPEAAPVVPPVPPVPPVVPAAPVAETVHAAADGDDIESTRISVPGHRLVFTWDDGTRSEVSRRTLFGRNPAPEEGAVLVSVRDETLSLSKTHFEAAAEASGGWVMDRHSTNGMTIVRGGERIACPPGEKVRVRLGDAIEIGDRIVTVGGYV